jgi:N-acetylneuraminic acid mutarotase
VPGGAQSVTNNMTISGNDPILACMWGSPASNQGFRTTWFRFSSPVSGQVTIDTAGSTYDTVLAVYSGGCDSLTQLACNDDYNYFSSRVTVQIFANRDYYVEVADWHFAVSGKATASVSAWLDLKTNWEIDHIMEIPRTRHAAVVLHDNIYVVAGQTVAFGDPQRTPRTDRYNTTTRSWTQLANMPAGTDGLGYSNTTAAHVNAKIYLPSGYVGDNSIYDGTHWVYDIASNSWSTATPAPWVGGAPAIYGSAVAYTGGGQSGYYLTGGLTGPMPLSNPNEDWTARRELYFYSATSNGWETPTSMNIGRLGHTAALQNIGGSNYICVIGGIGQDGDNDPVVLSAGECYNINGDSWSITTGQLNYPRYYAGSAVDQNGDWYVFGGTNNLGQSVAITEKYDRATNTWRALDVRFNLGSEDPNEPLRPARAWPRGGFVGQTLWVVGGHRNTGIGDLVITLVEKLFLPLEEAYFPFFSRQLFPGEPDDTFNDARRIFLNQTLYGTLYHPDDYVEVYYFDLATTRAVSIFLRHIGLGNEYDLHLYTNNKLWLSSSTQPGDLEEVIGATLGPGRYFIMVERVFPPPGADPDYNHQYQIELRG